MPQNEVGFFADTSQLEQSFKTLEKMYPVSTKKAVADYLNDMARLFKDLAPKIIGEKYTIRNKGFVNRQFKVKRAKASERVDDQMAEAFTEAYDRFTGWEEEITGGVHPMRSTGAGRYHREMTLAARGGSHEAQVKGQFRLRPGGEGFNSDILPDSRQYGMPIPQFLAMISKSPKDGSGNKRIGKNKTFIMGGASFPLGLYRLKDGVGTAQPEVEMLQKFNETPRRAEKFDWQDKTIQKVNAWFNPKEVWKTYFEPIISRLWKKK